MRCQVVDLSRCCTAEELPMPRTALDIVDSSHAEAPRDEGAPQLSRR